MPDILEEDHYCEYCTNLKGMYEILFARIDILTQKTVDPHGLVALSLNPSARKGSPPQAMRMQCLESSG